MASTMEEILGVRLKKEQKSAIEAANENDVVCVLPTGFGKTKIIEGLAHLTSDGVILVINGLSGIINQQRSIFPNSFVLSCEFLKQMKLKELDALTNLSNLKQGVYRYILSHPEQVLQTEVKQILMSSILSEKISHIVVDEAHCILSWGQSNFRPAYQKLGSLRTILPKAKIVALTATATLKGQTEIKNNLYMHDPIVISASPDRPNVFLEVQRRLPSTGGKNTAEDSIFSCVDPILKTLQEQGTKYPKTIIYLPLKWCGLLHERAKTCFATPLVAQYHAPQSQQMKSHIVKEMTNSTDESTIRVLFATEAYGMGMDVADIRKIVHVSPPSSVETFVQEIGRCGRDGQESSSVLFHNNSDTSKSHIKEGIREYIKTTECRRKFIVEYFGFSYKPQEDPHRCCDNCLMKCTCVMCKTQIIELKLEDPNDSFDKGQIQCFKLMLQKYFHAENSIVKSMTPALETGLSAGLIESICKVTPQTDLSQVELSYPVLKKHHLLNIVQIIEYVKSKKI